MSNTVAPAEGIPLLSVIVPCYNEEQVVELRPILTLVP